MGIHGAANPTPGPSTEKQSPLLRLYFDFHARKNTSPESRLGAYAERQQGEKARRRTRWAHHASAIQALAGGVPSATVSFLSIAMTSPRIGCAGPVAGV